MGSGHGFWWSLGLAWANGDRLDFAEPGVAPHYAPSRVVRIRHIDLTLRLWPARKRFEGEATIRIDALPAYVDGFALDLDEVEVLEVVDGDGVELDWRHEGPQLEIRSSGPAPTRVVVRWRGENPRHGLFFTGPIPSAPDRVPMAWTQCQDEDAHFLLPCHDHPGIKHTWRIQLEGPARCMLLSNGRQLSDAVHGERRVTVWEQSDPMPAYLLTAVCAELTTFEDTWEGRPVRYLVPVGREAHARAAMGATPAMMTFLSERTGVAYPWPRYDQVVVDDFIFGGMENTACTSMSDLLLAPPEARLEWSPEGLVVHELAHQWFGDLLTCQDWSQGWLNESWATLCEALWWEHAHPEDAVWYRFRAMNQYLAEHDGRYLRPIVSYRFREPLDVFDRHLYQKGSCVLWTLRGELGEAAFWQGATRYLEDRRHDTVHTRDFQRAMEVASGRNLDRFFDSWVHSAGHPCLDVALRAEDGLLIVEVKQTQTGEDVPEAFELSLRLELCDVDGGVRVVTLPVRERARVWALPRDKDLRTVRVDPGLAVLAQISLSGRPAWLEALLDDPCPVLAIRAARGLLAVDSPRGVRSVLRAAASHPHWSVRAQLMTSLSVRGGNGVRDLLVQAAREDADPRVRARAVGALAPWRETGVVDELLAMLEGPLATDQLHGAVLLALGTTRDARALAPLRAALQEAGGWGELLHQRALAGLAATRDPSVLEDLLAHTGDVHMERVRSAAAHALGTLGEAVPEVRRPVRERLIEMLKEPGLRVLLGAVAGLRTLKDPAALGPLERLRATAHDGRARRMAYEAAALTRRGRGPESGLALLRSRVEALAAENRSLKARLDRLER